MLGAPMAVQTSETLRSRRTRRPGLSGIWGRTNWCPGLSDCSAESLHLGMVLQPGKSSSALRPSQAGLVSHPDSDQLVCLPEEVTRGGQAFWRFSQMQHESYSSNNQTVRPHLSIKTDQRQSWKNRNPYQGQDSRHKRAGARDLANPDIWL